MSQSTVGGPRALVADDEVLTGEAVALDLQPLGLGLRVLGGLIDTILVWAIYLAALFWAVNALIGAGILAPAMFQILAVVLMVVCFAAVPISVELLTRGRSLGKLAAGGRIVRTDGGAIGFRHAFIRGLIGVLEVYMTFGGVALLVGIFSPRAQRLGDLVAGTYSERARRPHLPPPVQRMPDELAAWADVADVARLDPRLDAQVARFSAAADTMHPGARAQIAAELAPAVAPFVSPVPNVPPEVFLTGVAAIRRKRERAVLRAEHRDATRLGGVDPITGIPAAPEGA